MGHLETTLNFFVYSVARNSKTSPLLKLPIELRRRIWGYTIGHRTIHILRRKLHMVRLTHNICHTGVSEQESSVISPDADMSRSSFGHADCYYHPHFDQLKLDIDILQVCRQIYVEANPILWETTTWAFNDVSALDLFLRGKPDPWWELHDPKVQGRSAVQRKHLKKLHLEIDLDSCWDARYPAWQSNKEILSKFGALDVLYLDLMSATDTKALKYLRGKQHTPCHDIDVQADNYDSTSR